MAYKSGYLILFLGGLLFASSCFASNSLLISDKIGFYCESVASSTYINGGRYLVNGTDTCHYLGNDLPAGTSWYGDLYEKKSYTEATLLNGHSLSSLETFDKTETENFIVSTSSKIYFVVIYDYGDTDCGGSLREYLQNTASSSEPVGCDWGTLLWTDLPSWSGDWNFIPPPPEIAGDYGVLGNYIRDILLWLFKPNESSINKFSELSAIFETKSPFAYFFTIKNSFLNVSSTSTPEYTTIEYNEDLQTGIFDYLKNIIAVGLWIFFGFWVVRKISNASL